MVAPVTRQEVQSVLDRTIGSIKGNMLTKGDLQNVISQIRSGILQDLHSLHAENKSAINQSINHRDQLAQRINGIEHSISRLEQLLSHMISQQSRTSDRMQNMKSENPYMYQRI